MGKVKKVSSYRQRRSKEELEARNLQARTGATRYCVYGLCKSDSRNFSELCMDGVTWVPFPKPHIDKEKCLKWVAACGREDFDVNSVKKWTCLCSKHFVGGSGPTDEHPDPIPACYDDRQMRYGNNRTL